MKNISGKLLASSARLSAAALLSSFAYIAHAGIAAREYLDLSKWDVGDYVQDGLVLHYDGIRNVGADQPHSSDTTIWANLAPNTPNKDMEWSSRGYASLSASRGTNSEGEWSSNGFVFNGKACWIKWNDGGSNPVVVPSQYTMQFAMTANTADQTGDGQTGYLLELNDGAYGWTKGSVAIRETDHDSGYTTANAVYAVDEDRLGSTKIRPYFNDATPSYATVLADAFAVRVFSGTTLPEAGTSGCAAINGTSPSRSSTVIALGGLYNKIGSGYTTKQFQGFTGTLHNFRIYSSALNEDQLKQNRIVDEARFFGRRTPISVTNAVIASTYSFLDGAEPAGIYAVDGSHDFTAPATVEIDGFAYACTGCTIETWNYATESWGDPVMNNGVLSVTISASDRKRVTWLWKATRAAHTADDYTLADYSPAGLVLNYDGIYNDGADNPHSTTTQKWKNLAQGWEDQDMYAVNYSKDNNTGEYNSINVQNNNLTMNGAWNETSGYVFNGKECFMKWNEGRKFILPPAYTWQFSMDATTANQSDSNGGISYLFLPHDGNSHGSWMNGSVQMRATELDAAGIPANSIVLTDGPRYGTTNIRPCFSDPSPRFATVLADSKAARVFGGVEIPTSGLGYKEGALAATRTNNWFAIGGQYNPSSDKKILANFQGFHGTMHSVRFYDRPLTEEELERNREADSARFFGELATTNVVEVIGDAETAYKVEGSWTFNTPGTIEIENAEKAVAGYRLTVLEDGVWVRKPFCRETTFTYSQEAHPEIYGKTIKLEWAPEPPGMMIIVR